MDDGSPHLRNHPGLFIDAVHSSRHLEDRTRSPRSSRSYNSNSVLQNLELGPNLNICQLNIEGISKDKCQYLSRLAEEFKVDVILLQETHTATEEQLRERGDIIGYILIDSLNSPVYGSATYVKQGISDYETIHKQDEDNIFVIVTKISNIHIINVYKPPNIPWPITLDLQYPHPAIFIGDFNCHHNMWGYEENDRNGISLVNWMELRNLQLIFDAKDRKSFRSARWQKDYNPDLCLVTKNNYDEPLENTRVVLNDFPRSQHRPTLVKVGVQIPVTSSLQKSRWNFKLADWKEFRKQVDSNLRWIPATCNNFNRFVGVIKAAAKRTIPRGFRKNYIPCWSKETNKLYENYKRYQRPETADELLHHLNVSRKEKWNDTMQNMNFTHSSRNSWTLLRKLGTATQAAVAVPKITPNAIASRLTNVSNTVKLSNTEIKKMQSTLRGQRRSTLPSETLSKPFIMEELKSAIKMTKARKAAGFDGIYPEFIKNLGSLSLKWLLFLFNQILVSGRLPSEFKKAKVIAILKTGKPANEASSYRPISLLSVCYKILERLIYNRISPIIEDVLPPEQAGFRINRSCCDQVLALTTHIEAGFQRRLKTAVALVDLTAAYDTVWKDGLIHKLYKAVSCGRLINLIENMLSNRRFKVFLGEKSSKFKFLRNGLPQGSVLAPLLFNLYTSDLPQTKCRKFIYADDLALTFQHQDFVNMERVLAADLCVMNGYFKKWRLCLNPSKTEVCCFHLANNQKNRKLEVVLEGRTLKHNFYPKYLGITLDTSLTYKFHIEKLRQKLKTRNNILHKLAGSNWGASAKTLRIAALALVYSSAEYCCPVWMNSVHVSKVDSQLNAAMRIISGTLKSTPLPWLPVLANITPPDIRRKHALKREWSKYQVTPELFPISKDLQSLPPDRLVSRKPIWKEGFINVPFSAKDLWKNNWQMQQGIFNHSLITDPTKEVSGLDLSRKVWSNLNRLRTGHGRCNYMLNKWNEDHNPACQCGHTEETISHIVTECPLTKFSEGFLGVHLVTPEALDWLATIKPL